MSNKLILLHLQDKGLVKANPFALDDWRHYQQLSSHGSRKQRHIDRQQELKVKTQVVEVNEVATMAAAVPLHLEEKQ